MLRPECYGCSAFFLFVAACTPLHQSGQERAANLTRVYGQASIGDCPAGGQALAQGVDLNTNGALDDNEVQSIVVVCNGQSGSMGMTGATGPTGPEGPAGHDGVTGPTGPANTNDHSCTITANGNGTKTIVCDDGTAVTVTDAGYCGDTLIDQTAGENCDDGNAVTEACPYGTVCTVCRSDCTTGPGLERRCGDAVKQQDFGEACDDGNQADGDYCAGNCTVVTGFCGDHIKQSNEACDDGFTDSCGTCNATCSGPGTGSSCGDGYRCEETEACDDAFADACGTCNSTCSAPGSGATCGDGNRCAELEACDDGFTDACGTCNADCSGAGSGSVCGDGSRCFETEGCDDGADNGLVGACSEGCTAPCSAPGVGCYQPTSGILGCSGGATTWNATTGYYGINAHTLVPAGCTLTIQPGVHVRYFGDYYLKVDGSLAATGTSGNRIRFDSSTDQYGSEALLVLPAGRPTTNLSYVDFDAKRTCISSSSGTVVSHSSFQCSVGVLFSRGVPDDLIVQDSLFSGCSSALLLDDVSGSPGARTFQRNTVNGVAGAVGIDLFAGRNTLVQDNVFDGVRALRCYASRCTNIVFTHNDVSNSAGPISFEEWGSTATVTYNNFEATTGGPGSVEPVPSAVFFRGDTLTLANNNFTPVDPSATILKVSSYSNGSSTVTATNNFWGDAVSAEMLAKGATGNISVIYDYLDDFNRASAPFSPWLTVPEPTAGPR